MQRISRIMFQFIAFVAWLKFIMYFIYIIKLLIMILEAMLEPYTRPRLLFRFAASLFFLKFHLCIKVVRQVISFSHCFQIFNI